jgi:drug/metabolite transporter (DMT)-like permease
VSAGTAVDAAGQTRAHPNRVWLYSLIGLMQAFWTANFLIGKIVVREFPPFIAAGLRVSIAALGMLPLYWWRVRGREQWSSSDLPRLVTLGIIGIAINQVAFIAGLGRTSVAHSSIIIGITPVWVLLLAGARGLERITRRKLAGLLAAFTGVAILGLERQAGSGPTLAGDLLTLAAAFAFAFFTVLSKEVAHRHDPFTVNTIVFGSGAVALLPALLWQGSSFSFGKVSVAAWLSLLYMGLFPSLVCYLIFYYALHYVPASRLAMLAYLQPVAATTLGVLLLGERVTLPLVLGGAVILGGVYIAERGRWSALRREPRADP